MGGSDDGGDGGGDGGGDDGGDGGGDLVFFTSFLMWFSYIFS